MCPPPIRWITTNGLTTPKANAVAGCTRRERASSTVPTPDMMTPMVANPRNNQTAVAGSWPDNRTAPSEVRIDTGPYGAGAVRHTGSTG